MDNLDELEEQCDSGYTHSCLVLGGMYYKGKDVKQDYSKAIEYYQKACDLNAGDGCFALGAMYCKAKGVKQDYSKAIEYYQKACDLGNNMGCLEFGSMYKQGKGVKQSEEKAVEYWDKALNSVTEYWDKSSRYNNQSTIKRFKNEWEFQNAQNPGNNKGCLIFGVLALSFVVLFLN